MPTLTQSLPASVLLQMGAVAAILVALIVIGIVISGVRGRKRQQEMTKLKGIEEARRRRRERRQLQEQAQQTALALINREAVGSRRTKRRSLVMVVDDSPTVLTAARKALEEESYRVITVENGREAWAMLQEERPDLIISDIEMPKVNGFQLLKLVREDMEMASLPVMLMTSHLYYDVKMGHEAGANAFLTKPYEAEDLVEQVRYLLTD
jgi:CheY-like chemotaxis protein